MKPGGGKQKGSAFERTVCTKLSLWVTSGRLKDCFWRSAMSGGRATVHAKKGADVRQAGDITAVAPEGHPLTDRVYIECKHYKDLQFTSFVLTNKGELANFWQRTRREAAKRGKAPWLIARENNRPTLLIVDRQFEARSILDYPICKIYGKNLPVHVYLFDEVLLRSPPIGFTLKERERL